MATNDFQPFAASGTANVISQSQYLALPALAQGFSSGPAVSAQLNKVWRQSSIMASVLASIVSSITGANVTDDGTTATILSNLRQALLTASYAVDTGTLNAYLVSLSPAPAAYAPGMRVSMMTGTSNTVTNPTLNVSGLGAVPITLPNGVALSIGQIPTNTVKEFVYNAAGRFEMQDGLQQGYADTRYLLSQPGLIVPFAGISAPPGYLACPTAQTNISRTAYAALFAAIGTTWGIGDGSTTFGMPWFPADYTLLQAAANVGSTTAGQVIAHTHTLANVGSGANILAAGGVAAPTYGTSSTGSTGGAQNTAAGSRVLLCVKY